ncbi:uncharacterized protein A4U43_C03F21930 [Asparagus officinalis]|uniref:Uncharacterized protein n=1 Tax=Asparagus officinalis TaxID=4686 RepID=A0A5P1FEU3_ASPOF|nr:uncharacterized protein A4U43_C03F21930 [Asparagus officinalis]
MASPEEAAAEEGRQRPTRMLRVNMEANSLRGRRGDEAEPTGEGEEEEGELVLFHQGIIEIRIEDHWHPSPKLPPEPVASDDSSSSSDTSYRPPHPSPRASDPLSEFMTGVHERLGGIERRQEELVGRVDGLGHQVEGLGHQLAEILTILKPSQGP